MDAVVQEEISGCGIAACAALAGISYAASKARANALGIYAEDPTLWSRTDSVRRLAGDLGLVLDGSESPFCGWDALPDRALLSIKWRVERGQPLWHWVAFVREAGGCYVLDSKKSLKTNHRVDFGRMKPKWFIAVEAES